MADFTKLTLFQPRRNHLPYPRQGQRRRDTPGFIQRKKDPQQDQQVHHQKDTIDLCHRSIGPLCPECNSIDELRALLNASANLYSLIETANGLESYAYLRQLFTELPKAEMIEAIRFCCPATLARIKSESAEQARSLFGAYISTT